MALSTISGTTGITDATITSAKLADFAAAVDLNGVELILDADQDTSITADTDDRIDFKIAGVEHISISNSSGDTIIKPMVDAKDIVFQQYDGNKILEINDGNYVAISGAAAGPGELRFYEDTDLGSHYTGFKAGNATASISYVLPLADGSANQQLTTDGSGTLSWANQGADPISADGDSLGTASLEWSDLYLADGGIVYFGADQDVLISHVHNLGLTLKNTSTGDDTPFTLTLSTGETDIAQDDVLARIQFQAPDESTGTDAVLVAAGIQAVSEGDFSSSSNATKLSFLTAASEAATEKMSLSSAGLLTIADDLIIGDGKTIGSASDPDAITIASGGGVTFTQTPVFPDGSLALADLDIDGGTDIGAAIVDADLFIVDDGAGGTNRKVTASRIKTYAGGLTGVSTGSGNVTIDDGNLIVASGHGIDFSATANLSAGDATMTQELFDDYEEGTWTAAIASNSGSITVSTSNDECTYVKIGRHVFLNGSLVAGSVSSPSGRLQINNKPYNSTGGEGGHRGVGTCMIHSPASDVGSAIVPMIFEDYDPIRFHNGSSGDEINANIIDASAEIRFAINYHAG